MTPLVPNARGFCLLARILEMGAQKTLWDIPARSADCTSYIVAVQRVGLKATRSGFLMVPQSDRGAPQGSSPPGPPTLDAAHAFPPRPTLLGFYGTRAPRSRVCPRRMRTLSGQDPG